jgi:hypothetical protein
MPHTARSVYTCSYTWIGATGQLVLAIIVYVLREDTTRVTDRLAEQGRTVTGVQICDSERNRACRALDYYYILN